MLKLIRTIFSSNSLQLKQILFYIHFAMLIAVVLPTNNYSQSLPKISRENARHINFNINSLDNINPHFAMYDNLLYRFKGGNSLFNQKIFILRFFR